MNNKQNNHESWIEANIAVEIAQEKVSEFSLNSNPDIRNALNNGYPENPLFVKKLGKPEFAYYLIPWRIIKGVVFIVRVDASSGDVLEVRTFPKPTPSPFLSPNDALVYAQNKYPTYKFGNPNLVWQPCEESTTAMEPFYMIPYNHRTLFVGMNKNIFHKPTPLKFG